MSKKISVALIEDDRGISSMYSVCFERDGGFVLRVAYDGMEGLELLKTFHPDVILLDMMMPRMSGMETLESIRALPDGENIKVITLTNMNDPETVDKIKKLGAVDHIVKADVTPSEVVATVRKAIEQTQ
jgi:CheY-like chemotaxis protein